MAFLSISSFCFCFSYLRIRPGEEIQRDCDPGLSGKGNPQTTRKTNELAKYVHAVIFVVKANDPRLKDRKYENALKKIREHFREDGKKKCIFCASVVCFLDLTLNLRKVTY